MRRRTITVSYLCILSVIFFVWAAVACFVTVQRRVSTLTLDNEQYQDKVILTSLGNTSYSTIEWDVYNPMGYSIVEYVEPFAVLKENNPQTCTQVFLSWFIIASTHNSNSEPPRALPYELLATFTLKTHAYAISRYFDDRLYGSSDQAWNKTEIDEEIANTEVMSLDYPGQGEAMYYATKFHSLAEMTGIVVGSTTPWVEVFCLQNGAKKLVSLEYNKILSDDERLEYHQPINFAQNWSSFAGTFDFAASFSIIGRIGLGRYGEALDSVGDIREVQKVRCLLKDGGLFFLGLRAGADGIVFNEHRVYGRLRLPLLFEGFELLNIFYGTNEEPIRMPLQYFERRYWDHYVFVLRKKIATQAP